MRAWHVRHKHSSGVTGWSAAPGGGVSNLDEAVDLLTFSEAAGQQFVYTADLLTFSEDVSQHLNHTAILLTF